jgi:hypothetical protein
MHNESMADRVVDGTAEEITGDNNGHVSEIKDVKPGIEFHIRISRNTLIGVPVAIVVGTILGRKLNLLAAKTAPVLQEAADKVEEVAS